MSPISLGEAHYRRLQSVLRSTDQRKLAEWIAAWVSFYDEMMGKPEAMPNAVANSLERAGYAEETSFRGAAKSSDVATVVGHAVAYLIYAVRQQGRISMLVVRDCELVKTLL